MILVFMVRFQAGLPREEAGPETALAASRLPVNDTFIRLLTADASFFYEYDYGLS